MSFDLGDYKEVKDRVLEWYELHPDGRIVADPPRLVTVGERFFIASTARVYKNETEDTLFSQGSAWEPFPGKTPYTKDSEAMNAETSAIGRALAAAGIGVKKGMASRDEINLRSTRLPLSDVEHLKDRLRALPGYVQGDVKRLVTAGPRLELLTAEQLDEAHAFVTAIEDEIGGEP